LIISVDTSVAHLAGALGKPVWMLAQHSADWRWFLDRADTPWYPTMRLFRQAERDRWEAPIRQVTEALRQLAGSAEIPIEIMHNLRPASPAGRLAAA
jgi:ADP-heptose:LPS heptosyltransferase